MKRFCLGAGLCLLLAYIGISAPLPPVILRNLILWCDGWILTDYQRIPSVTGSTKIVPYLKYAAEKFVATRLEQCLIQQFQSHLSIPDSLDDVGRLGFVLPPLKRCILTQAAVRHHASSRPIFVSGIGWCDQIHGVSGRLLASYFPISQTYSLYDPVANHSPHTMGRVWSRDFDDWIYYDFFYPDIRIFRYRGVQASKGYRVGSGIVGLVQIQSNPDIPIPPSSSFARLYSFIDNGFVLNEYSSTFGGYICHKVWQAITSRKLASITPLTESRPQQPAVPMDTLYVNRLPSKELMRQYLKARLEHILGDPILASQSYARIARESNESINTSPSDLEQAASVFSHNLSPILND